MRLRFWIPVVLQLLLFAALNLFDDWTIEKMPRYFVASAILCGLAYLLAATEFSAAGRNVPLIFWSVAIALRLLALPLTPAAEVWRYKADAAIQRSQLNPYQVAPADPRVTDSVPDFESVPRSDVSTAFAPGSEILFRLIPAGSGALGYKLLFGSAELLAIFALSQLLPLREVVWFAWNPLSAYSFFGAAHFDSIVLLAIAVLILFLSRHSEAEKSAWKTAIAAALALAIAIAFRPIIVVLLLPAAFALRRKALALLLSIAIPLCCLLPFGSSALQNVFGDFNHVTRLNDLFWWIVEDTFLPNWHQQYYRYDAIILVVCALVGAVFWRNWSRGMLWSIGAVLILAPVLHPWYVLWILPLATLRHAYAWHFLSVTIFAYYLFFNERLFALPWHAEPWMRGIIVMPVLFALAMLASQKLRLRRAV